MTDLVPVRISVASMFQKFNGCEPEYIRTVCFGRCCDAPSRPSGTMISIHPSEVDVIIRRGGRVEGGLLQTPDRVCTFKDTESFLCNLHTTPDKPFGCIASPFTLNAKDCLIVRNRYRMLPCYRKREEGGVPAYEAFRAGLDLIFGRREAGALVDNITAASESFVYWMMPLRSYEILRTNDETKRAAAH